MGFVITLLWGKSLASKALACVAPSSMKFWITTLKSTFKDFMEDKALRLAAALAYYSIFSLAPLLIIIIAIAGFVLDETTVRQQLQQQMTELVGAKSAETLQSMTEARKMGSTPVAMTLGIIALLFGRGRRVWAAPGCARTRFGK
jgi:membrane protein